MARGNTKRKAGGAAKADPNGTQADTSTEEPAQKTAKVAVTEEAGAASAPSAPPKSVTKTSAFKAPDAAEVLEIAQTRNLFKSNLFRLQLQELLRELAPSKSHARLEAFLHGLQPILLALQAREIPQEFAAEFPQLCFHRPQPFPFSFRPPKRIDIVGSFLLGLCMRPHLHVDLALEMPSDVFRSKDYLNFRYLDKRAAYVGELYRQLSRLSTSSDANSLLAGMDIQFEALQGDAYRPCIALRPARNTAESRDSAWTVRLLPVCAADLWIASKLAPDRNAVRPAQAEQKESAQESAGNAMPASAHYNSCVLEDCRMRLHLEYLHRAMQKVPALRDAILLLKRWAASRGFLPQGSKVSVFVPLNGFVLSMVAAHAVQTSSLSASQTSSFQVFKLALTVLSSTSWGTQKVILGKAAPAALSAEECRFCGAHFYDSDGIFNFFWRLGPFISEVQRQAKRSLSVLDAENDPYDAVFGARLSPELAFDLCVRSDRLGATALCPDLRGDGKPVLSTLGKPHPADAPEAHLLATRLAAMLEKGLTDRSLSSAARLVGSPCFSWREERPTHSCAVMVGVTLDAFHLDRVLDRGPSAQESNVASQFRTFWGPEKAELRRFKDGSILECVVWSKPPAERQVESKKQPAVVTQIVKHVLARHFPQQCGNADVVAGPLGFVQNLRDSGRRLWGAFEEFRTHLAQLSSLPLSIKDIHPAGVTFTYTDVGAGTAPPAADGIARTLHGVVVEFESSGRWPDDPKAAQKVCTALLLQMREELLTDLGVESDVTEDFLDVRYPEVVFRVQVYHQHELTATAHRVTNFQVQSTAPAPEEEKLERLRTLWWRPRIVAQLHAQVLQRPAMAGTVRLCRQWMSSQMLSGYDEFVEHLATSVFLHPGPFDMPTSPQVGFCRICWLLDTFDWGHEPLIVDFDGKLTEEERLSMRRSFEDSRANAKGASSFWICSRFDPHAMLLKTPPATVSLWLQRRARHCLDVYNKRLLGLQAESAWRNLFSLDTSIFDIIIKLLPPGDADASAKKKGGHGLAQRRSMAVGEASASFLEKLRLHLSPVCLVFHDITNGIVALKWRPGAFLPQHHSVLMGSVPHTMLSRGKDQTPLAVPNVLCLTSFVSSLAEGLAVDVAVVGDQS